MPEPMLRATATAMVTEQTMTTAATTPNRFAEWARLSPLLSSLLSNKPGELRETHRHAARAYWDADCFMKRRAPNVGRRPIDTWIAASSSCCVAGGADGALTDGAVSPEASLSLPSDEPLVPSSARGRSAPVKDCHHAVQRAAVQTAARV